MSDESTTVEVKGLDKLLKALKGKMPVVRVGILSGDAARAGTAKGQSNNAEIGAFHEFGTSRHPVRSFLRMPLSTLLTKRLESSGLLNRDVLKEVMAQGSVIPWLKKVAIISEGIVADAFDSDGFGTWPPSDMSKKKNHQTLVETQQLRNSITSDIKE